MKPTKGYYSLIQYCPDVARHEAANLGVLLFCPEFSYLQARLASTNHRVRRFFGEEADQYRHLNAMKAAFEERLQVERSDLINLDSLQVFVETRANKLVLTRLKPVRVFEPEQDLNLLYQQLVE